MTKHRLDEEEQEILEAFERGSLKSVPNVEREIQEARRIARNTLTKNKRVNVRLTERDFERIQLKALEEGIPYQTLIGSLIHKYLTGQLIAKKES